MTFTKIACALLAFSTLSSIATAQKNNVLYTQFTGKRGTISFDYDRKIGSMQKENVDFSLYGHIGIGQTSSNEVIATKFVKGNNPNPNTGSLPLDVLIFVITREPDKTLEKRQYFDVTNYSLGSKILLGKGKFNGIVGLDVRLDQVNQRIDAWENTPEQTKNFNNTALSPSVGLRWNKHKFMVQSVLTLQTTYGLQNSTDGRLNVGFGFQF